MGPGVGVGSGSGQSQGRGPGRGRGLSRGLGPGLAGYGVGLSQAGLLLAQALGVSVLRSPSCLPLSAASPPQTLQTAFAAFLVQGIATFCHRESPTRDIYTKLRQVTVSCFG